MAEARLLSPHGHDFTALAECLRSFIGTEVVFVPNPGNAGDNLINAAAYRLFERLGVRYVVGTRKETYPDRVIVHSGGGSMVEAYAGSDVFFRRNHPICRALVLMPHTVRTYPDLIAGMDGRCTLFLREKPSFDFVSVHATGARVHLGHDLACFLADADIAAMPWSLAHALGPKIRLPWPKIALKLAAARRRGPVLHALRTDLEATDVPLPSPNHDLSRMFATADMSRASCFNTVKVLRHMMRMYETVETNRLHVTILAAIVGRQVRMLDNSYGKNSAVHAQSIAGYFPNVRFETAGARA